MRVFGGDRTFPRLTLYMDKLLGTVCLCRLLRVYHSMSTDTVPTRYDFGLIGKVLSSH